MQAFPTTQHLVIDNQFKSHIRPLRSEEREKLEASILADGCRDALIVWQAENILLDGHNRYEICTQHDMGYRIDYLDFECREDALDWLIDNQLGRRNLTKDETDYYIGKKYNRLKKTITNPYGKNQHSEVGAKSLLQPKTADKLAQETNLSHQTVKNHAKYANSVDTLADVLGDEIRENILSNDLRLSRKDVQELAEIAIEKPQVAEKILTAVKSGNATFSNAINDIKKEEKKQERENKRLDLIQKADASLTPDDIVLHYGDFQNTLAYLEDDSVDAIITDPSYPREFLPLWDNLGEFASKKLKPGGFLVAYSGQLYLPQVMTMLGNYLEYYWLGGLYHQGIQAQRFERHVQNAMKPILIYCKPPIQKQPMWFVDMVTSPSGDKDHHEWGQSLEPVKYLVERFSNAGELIVEPFAGGGTTLIACHDLKRRCVASEIDSDSYKLALARLNQAVTYDPAV